MENNNGKSLYERLGSAEGISNLVDDIVDAHMNNPGIQTRYLPMKEDSERMEKVKKYTRQFLGQVPVDLKLTKEWTCLLLIAG